MTQKELKTRLNKLRRNAKVVGATKESALAFLVKAGIATKSGKLAKPYR